MDGCRHILKSMFCRIEAGGTKFVCGIGTRPDDLKTAQFPTSTPAITVASVVDFFKTSGPQLDAIGNNDVVRESDRLQLAYEVQRAKWRKEIGIIDTTAANHLHEALQDLSRRPQPDLAGAVYHAMGSLECLARDVTGDPKATLGEVLKRNSGLLPKPLDTALSQVWGYASNEARRTRLTQEKSCSL